MGKFDYKKAEADLHDSGARHPDEIYSYKSDKAIRGFMRENGLNPDRYYSSNDKSGGSSEHGSEGCYLTSACVGARGLPDNCDELQTLRRFRDGYLAVQPGGREEIERYYALAPGIVTAIDRLQNAAEVWDAVFRELIEPCVELIRSNRSEEAHRLYREYSLKLSELYPENGAEV